MVPAGSPGAGTTPTPFAGQAYVRQTLRAEENMKLGDPYILGINEHIDRILLLVNISQEKSDQITNYRLLIYSIYSCRAIVELMLEAASKDELKSGTFDDCNDTRTSLEKWIRKHIKYYDLIEKIRIHDFHRFGLIPPDPEVHSFQTNGPVKLVTQRGSTQIQYPDGIPNQITTGNSQIMNQRPLLIQNGLFYDESISNYVAIKDIVETFMHDIKNILLEFKGMVKNKQLEIEI